MRYLQARGMQLLARNVRFKCGELDLVMQDQNTIVFVEVRYRSRSRFGPAAATVDARKQARLRRAAGIWLGGRCWRLLPACRFDVLAMDAASIVWIANAF